MNYICALILLFTLNIQSSDKFYYNFNEKISLFNSDYYTGIKTNKNFSIKEIKNHIENLDKDLKIEDIKNVGNDLFLLKFSSKINNMKNLFNKAPFILYQIEAVRSSAKEKLENWPRFIDKQIVVKFKKNTNLERIQKILKENNLYLKNPKTVDYNIFLILRTDIDSSKVLDLANKLEELPEVEFSHPDFITIYKKMFIPDDTYFSQQWHHRNAIGGVNSVEAWDISMGSSSIKIAIVDDGVDENHEDLNVILSKNFSTEDENLGKEHGTACAGVAAAKGNNSKGMSGSCPNCSLISAKLLSTSGAVYVSASSTAIRWAVIMGADVISNSWGTSTPQRISEEFKNTLIYATTEGRKGKGSIVLFASGNEDRRFMDYEPSGQETVLAVGASQYEDKRTGYSNYGSSLDVVAPSSMGDYHSFFIDEGNIFTTDIIGTKGYNSEGKYKEYNITDLDIAGNYTKFFGGTSSSTPLVAGMAGLILSRASNLSYLEVFDIIKSSTDKIQGPYDDDGFSKYYGYGRVNIKKAMDKAVLLSSCTANDLGEICDNGIDDDCDNLVDSLDSDCKDYSPCVGYRCPKYSYCSYNSEDVELSCLCIDGFAKENGVCVSTGDPCRAVDCSGHGVCEFVDEAITCNCDEGYHLNDSNNDLKCEKDTPCTYVTCQENAFCNDSDTVCYCKKGFYPEGLECLPYDKGSLCEDTICGLNAKCSYDDGYCYCFEGYEYQDRVCVKSEIFPKAKKTDNTSCNYSRTSNSAYFYFLFIGFFLIFRYKSNNKKKQY